MRKKIIGIFICMLMIATVLPVAGAMNNQTGCAVKKNTCSESYLTTPTFSPGLITIRIRAVVEVVDDPYNFLGGTIHVNDTITGEYVYDSATPDTNPLATVGDYWHNSSSCGIEVNAGGFVFQTNPSGVNFLVEIVNDHGSPTPRDNYLLRSYNNLPLSNGILVEHIAWQLDDETCTALSNTDLPTTAPVLADWDSIFGLTLTGSDPSDPYKEYFIRARVTKATKDTAVDSAETEEPLPGREWRCLYFGIINNLDNSVQGICSFDHVLLFTSTRIDGELIDRRISIGDTGFERFDTIVGILRPHFICCIFIYQEV